MFAQHWLSVSSHSNKLRESGLFDEKYYRAQLNSEIVEGDLADHFLLKGEAKLLNPSASFDTAYYLKKYYTQTEPAKISPVLHYMKYRDSAQLRTIPLACEFDWPTINENSEETRVVFIVDENGPEKELDFSLKLVQEVSKHCRVIVFAMGGSNLVERIGSSETIDWIYHNKDRIFGPPSLDSIEVHYFARMIARKLKPTFVVSANSMSWPILTQLKSALIPTVGVLNPSDNLVRSDVNQFNSYVLSASLLLVYPDMTLKSTAVVATGENFEIKSRATDYQSQIHRFAKLIISNGKWFFDDNSKARQNADIILKSGIFEPDLFLKPNEAGDLIEAVQKFVFHGIGEEGRPLTMPVPGLNLLLYADLNNFGSNYGDALAHYIEMGMPSGSWKNKIIHPSLSEPSAQDLKAALIAEFTNERYFDEFLFRLEGNYSKPDLFISVCSEALKSHVELRLRDTSYKHIVQLNKNCQTLNFTSVYEFKVVLDEKSYDLVGVFHDKQNASNCNEAKKWRSFLWGNLIGTGHASFMMDEIFCQVKRSPSPDIVAAEFPFHTKYLDRRFEPEIWRPTPEDDPNSDQKTCGTTGGMFWAKAAVLWLVLDLMVGSKNFNENKSKTKTLTLNSFDRKLPAIVKSQHLTLAQTFVKGLVWRRPS